MTEKRARSTLSILVPPLLLSGCCLSTPESMVVFVLAVLGAFAVLWAIWELADGIRTARLEGVRPTKARTFSLDEARAKGRRS